MIKRAATMPWTKRRPFLRVGLLPSAAVVGINSVDGDIDELWVGVCWGKEEAEEGEERGRSKRRISQLKVIRIESLYHIIIFIFPFLSIKNVNHYEC